jgi:hypothetical protein
MIANTFIKFQSRYQKTQNFSAGWNGIDCFYELYPLHFWLPEWNVAAHFYEPFYLYWQVSKWNGVAYFLSSSYCSSTCWDESSTFPLYILGVVWMERSCLLL